VSLEFPKETYLNVVSEVLGQRFLSIDRETESFAAELVSIVYGSAKARLNGKGYSLLPALGTLLKGMIPVSSQDKSSVGICIPLKSGHGDLTLVLRVES